MPRGAASSVTRASAGPVWRIKYRDAAGKQVLETLGPEPPWTERKAQRELGKRLAAVDEGFRKPDRDTFAEFADRFVQRLPARAEPQAVDRSRTTDYMLDGHLLPFFGDHDLTELEARPELIDALHRVEGAERPLAEDDPEPPPAPQRHAAPRRRLAPDPHQPGLEHRPAEPRAARDERPDRDRDRAARDRLRRARRQGLRAPSASGGRSRRRSSLTALGTALRRGELVGLRWRAVNLLEAKIEVRETFVRGRVHDAEEQGVRRVVELGPRTLAVLEEQWQRTRVPCRRRPRLRPPDQGDAARDRQAREALPQAGARASWDREAVPALPRPPPHIADARRRGREPADLRPGASRPLAGLDHRALHARRPGALSGRGRAERGADVRAVGGRK